MSEIMKKEDWAEQREQTAMSEFEVAKQELLALRRQAGPIERQVIDGILYFIEGGIQGKVSNEYSLPPWYRKLVFGLASPHIGTKYRKFVATLRKFDPDEIAGTPEEILESEAEWRGNRDVGLLTLKAQHHAMELFRIISKDYVKDLLEAVNELADPGADPSFEPANYELARAWENLPDAIAYAHIACEMLSGAPESPETEVALGYAENIRECLIWAQACSRLQRAATSKPLRGADGTELDVRALGRDLYQNRIRRQITAEKGDSVVIDVQSGDYEVGEMEADARKRLLKRRPDAITWHERVGYPTPYTMIYRPQARKHAR